MRELALDPVGPVAHLVEPGASGSAGGMRAVMAAPAQHMQRLPERGDRHRLAAIVAPGEQVLMVAGDAVQRPQHLDRLPGQRHRMGLALLHALGRDAPERRIEVELGPACLHRLARAAQREPHQPEGRQRLVPTAVARHVAQQAADLVRLQRTLVLGLVGRQGAAHRIDRVAVNPQRGHGQLEHPGHAAPGPGRDARPVLARG